MKATARPDLTITHAPAKSTPDTPTPISHTCCVVSSASSRATCSACASNCARKCTASARGELLAADAFERTAWRSCALRVWCGLRLPATHGACAPCVWGVGCGLLGEEHGPPAPRHIDSLRKGRGLAGFSSAVLLHARVFAHRLRKVPCGGGRKTPLVPVFQAGSAHGLATLAALPIDLATGVRFQR
eukprot:365731-Chlamydomonas_euryale.AAC.9